jgi:hypothetical protein
MPKPREALMLLEETPYYHCVSRCVRRTFLCGVDTHTSKSYEHRRQWIVDRIKQLTDIVAIGACAYSAQDYQFTWRTIETWVYRFKKHGITAMDKRTRYNKNT